MSFNEFLGIFSAVLFLAGDTPYFINTLKKKIRPQRVTWGVFSVVNSVGFLNQYAVGATSSLWIFAAAVLANVLIFSASLRHGEGGYAKTDLAALIICMSGIVLWGVFDSPVLSIVANIIVAVAALYPTFLKAYKDPASETGSAWLFGAISAGLSAVSVGTLDIKLLILPITGAVLQAGMVYLLYFRPRKSKK